jgi:hypothetical protein
MILEEPKYDVENIKKTLSSDVESLEEYSNMLKGLIANFEQDIVVTREKAAVFLKSGQKENYGYLMEKIQETEMRIKTCWGCVAECEAQIAHKKDLLRMYVLF